MTTPPRARHRAPPLWVRLNQPTRNRSQVLLAWAVVGILVPPVTALGQAIAPDARAAVSPAVVALPSRTEEPTGRGGPLAPIFADVDAPQYEPEPVPPVSTPQGRRTATPEHSSIATSAPSAAQSPPAGNPVTPEPAPVPPAPAEPEPVVGLPVIEAAEPAAPPAPVIEEEPPVTETEPTPTPPDVVTEPTETETGTEVAP